MTPSLAWHLPPRRFFVLAAVVLTGVVVIIGQLTGMGVGGAFLGLTAGIAVPFTILGVLVLMSTPGHPVGRLMVAAGLTAALSMVGFTWSQATPLAWLGQWPWVLSFGLIFLALLLFPDGRLPSWRWWPVAAVIIVGTAVATVGLAVAAIFHPELLINPAPQDHPRAQFFARLALVAALVTTVAYLAVLGSLWARWRRADGETRRQLACLIPAGAVLFIGLTLEWYAVGGAWALATAAVPLGMAVAILRYRLYDVDLVVNRTIVWFLMTALVAIGVTATVWILSDALFTLRTESSSLLAIGLAVVAFQPLHRTVQRGVNRLLYGDRDDPYRILSELGDVLGATVEPTAVMPLVTRTIARSLQVPYVAVELHEPEGPVLVAEHGRAVDMTMTESFDMVSHGVMIGRLLVGRRSVSSPFTGSEIRLLRDVAVQAAVAAEATRLNRDLQLSRERLVAAREEERRRLRRDLHDGLGPSLAGMSMQVRAVQRQLPRHSRAAQILDTLSSDLRACTVEVRQLVDELRPPALDRGLGPALRAECERFHTTGLSVHGTAGLSLHGTAGLSVHGTAGLSVHCEVADNVTELPAAVEVAAFRIVAEALTNVVHHSGAQTCYVRAHRNGTLRVEIVDDGTGIAPAAHAGAGPRTGVGLSSMRERATELGGTCSIGPAPGGGTAVRVELPIGARQEEAKVAPSR